MKDKTSEPEDFTFTPDDDLIKCRNEIYSVSFTVQEWVDISLLVTIAKDAIAIAVEKQLGKRIRPEDAIDLCQETIDMGLKRTLDVIKFSSAALDTILESVKPMSVSFEKHRERLSG